MNVRSVKLKGVATSVAGLLAALLCLAGLVRHEAQSQLRHAAHEAAGRWAGLAGRSVTGLDRILAGEGVSPAARDQLLGLRGVDGIFGFRLFDGSGALVLASDDLERPGFDALPVGGHGLFDPHDARRNARIRDTVLAGGHHIELRREDRTDLPAVYSQAYVPVVLEGRVRGVAEVQVDQVERAAQIGDGFIRVTGAVTLFLLILAIAFLRFWTRAMAQRQSEGHHRYLTHHDMLTGALNRTGFKHELTQAGLLHAAGGTAFTLLCLDLDRFKQVNDSLGHAAGDEVLRVAIQRLSHTVREGDQIARLGGDEFAVLVPGLVSVDTVSPLAQRIVQALAEPYDISGQRVICGASVGAAIHGVDATDQDELLHKADIALYRAKANGRGTFSFYDVQTDAMHKARRELMRDLNTAVAADALFLHYQPLHACDSAALTGYEALLRWTHPTRGAVPPLEFIELAEETGLIDRLGVWVMQRACADAMGWPAPLSVAINVSPHQFARGDLVQVVTAALAASGLPAHRLELEITEALLMKNAEPELEQLRALAALGVSITIDDFGTGHSSLACLWRFPFNKIKIDRSFTQNLDNDPKVGLVVRSLIALAHSFNVRVNAGGVETLAQMTRLQAQGCDELQGYLFGRPGPLATLRPNAHANRRGAMPLAQLQRADARESRHADAPSQSLPSGYATLV